MKDYSENTVRAEYAALTARLIEKHLAITTMESATAGQIASLITDTEGSSAVIKGAFITYSNEAKVMQGVPEEIINNYSVYSRETASAMAERCREVYRADIGIGVTGTMGNADPANPDDSEPGIVYFAIDFRGSITSFMVKIPPMPSRLLYKFAVAKEIYEALSSMGI